MSRLHFNAVAIGKLTFLSQIIGLGFWHVQLNRLLASLFTALSFARGPLFQRSLILSNGIYRANNIFVALAIVMSLAGVFSILPLYYGFWELGRKVSLNPLEIARAFGAQLFDGLDGNMTARGIEIERGALQVRYGALERYGGEKLLRVEDSSRANVRTPRQGEIFG